MYLSFQDLVLIGVHLGGRGAFGPLAKISLPPLGHMVNGKIRVANDQTAKKSRSNFNDSYDYRVYGSNSEFLGDLFYHTLVSETAAMQNQTSEASLATKMARILQNQTSYKWV